MKRLLGTIGVGALLLSCGHPTRRWEGAVQVVRKEVVEKGEDGATVQVDFELEWDTCPGDQFQVIRGDHKFAACADQYEVGDYVPVVVRHFWDPHGFYRWDIERMGECARNVEVDALGSYEKSQECKEVIHYGKPVGFSCSRKPFRELVKRCPWMARD